MDIALPTAMRIEPVYLLAPKPAVPSIPTRRAFLFAGGVLVAGSAVGGACGYSLGFRRGAAEAGRGAGVPDAGGESGRKSSGDALLDELRRLAVEAPIEELVERSMFFTTSLSRSYRDDAVLWRGVGRLADEVVRNASIPNRRLLARFTAQLIEGAPPESASTLGSKRESLLGIR